MSSRKFLSRCFYGIAVLSLMFAIICLASNCGNRESYKEYGGDAYTGIQNAAAETANNVYELSNCVKTIGGYLFVVLTFTFGALARYNSMKADEELVERYQDGVSSDSNASNNAEHVSSGGEYFKNGKNTVYANSNAGNTNATNTNTVNANTINKSVDKMSNKFALLKKTCPFCGDTITSNKCDMCGKTNDLFKKENKSINNIPNISETIPAKHKKCPHCGEFVTSNVCEMCGNKNNAFSEK